MKFTVALPEFQKLLQGVLQAVPPKSTLPVLENFHFSLDANELTAVATDQELTIISSLMVDGTDNGEMLVPARKLNEIVKALGNAGSLTFIADENSYQITLKTNYGEYQMSGLDAMEFPSVPTFSSKTSATFSKEDISKIAQKCVFAVSKDEYRPAMTGVLFQFRISHLNAVATDAYRLVRVIVNSANATTLPAEEYEAIVPARTIELLKKVDSAVEMQFSDTHAKFILPGTTIITRLIDERFPAYESVIPVDNAKFAKFQISDLAASVKRVALFASATSRQIRFIFAKGTWTIIGEDLETNNKATESVHCEFSGEDLDVGFNYRYIEDALNHLAEAANSEAVMSFSSPTRPALLKLLRDGEALEDILMLIMPVRL